MESIQQTFNGSADFGKRVTCTISRNGDLIHRVYLQAKLPAVTATGTNTVCWVKNIGEALMNYVELEIGGQRIDRHYSDWLHIWNELTQTAGHAAGYYDMIGNTADLTLASLTSLPEKTIYVPLQFWFCRNAGLALPLIALQYHEVKVNIQFESLANLAGPSSTFPSGVSLGDTSLWVDYIYLDTDERRRFAQVSHEYLIEQVQFTGAESFPAGAKNAPIKMNFNHPCKSLYWVVQRDDAVNAGAGKDLFNYSDTVAAAPTLDGSGLEAYPQQGKNPVASAKIQLNGHDRFTEREGRYFNLVQPFQHHENVPANKGINMYSFALKPEEHQPSGTCNMSRIDTATLNLQLTSAATSGSSVEVSVFAVNYNVLRVMSGIKDVMINHITCAKQSAANDGYCTTILEKQCKYNLAQLAYNWLVVRVLSNCNKSKLSGTPSRALTTTPAWKHAKGTLGNDHGHSNNVKDWVIRSQAPAVPSAWDRVKVQRIDGFGGERNAILDEPLRYIPAPCKSTEKEVGEASRTQISQIELQTSTNDVCSLIFISTIIYC